MTLDNKLKAALIQAVDDELDALEAASTCEQHEFSESFVSNMDKTVKMSGHRYSTVFRRRIRRSSVIAIVAVLVLCMSITVYAIVKEIPLNIVHQDDYWSFSVMGREDTDARKDFEYIIPKTPEGFEVDEKFEQPTTLVICYKDSRGKSIIYEQIYAGDGQADLNIGDKSQYDIEEDTINGRKAIITHYKYDGTYSVIVEDGISVFRISGICDYDILYNMAAEVTSKDKE